MGNSLTIGGNSSQDFVFSVFLFCHLPEFFKKVALLDRLATIELPCLARKWLLKLLLRACRSPNPLGDLLLVVVYLLMAFVVRRRHSLLLSHLAWSNKEGLPQDGLAWMGGSAHRRPRPARQAQRAGPQRPEVGDEVGVSASRTNSKPHCDFVLCQDFVFRPGDVDGHSHVVGAGLRTPHGGKFQSFHAKHSRS